MNWYRCPGCGGLLNRYGGCDHPHVNLPKATPLPLPPPPATPDLTGRIVTYTWPTNGEVCYAMIIGEVDENDEVGIMILTENHHVALGDLTPIGAKYGESPT